MNVPAAKRASVDPVSSVVAAGRPVSARLRGLLGHLRVPAALLLLVVAGSIAYLWVSTPAADDLPARVASIDAAAGARPLPPGAVPVVLAHALVAVEDERFYAHHGLDTVGTARAVLADLSQGCACQGGSTITQQLAKLVYYPNDDRVARKLPDMALAFKLETHYGKPEIIAAYLSVVPTGYGLTGAAEASCAYFGHGLSTLTVAEAAELAGSVQAPSAYDPRYHPELAQDRRDYALQRMAAVGYLTQAQARSAMRAPVVAGGVAHPMTCS